MSFSFNGIEYAKKQQKNDVFTFNFNKKIKYPKFSYKEALYNNAIVMRENFKEPFDLCLSGGTDSEIVARVFKDLGIKHNTFIFRCENNINIRDVRYATELCQELNIPYKIIDFNLEKFYEEEAYTFLQKTFMPYCGRLPRVKFIDYLDNIPIFCEGEPALKRMLKENYNLKSEWCFYLTEDAHAVSIYSKNINRIVIGDWYEYTPEIIVTYLDLPYVKQLMNDKIIGKQSAISSKAVINQHIWKDLRYKQKLVGYEGEFGEPASRPKFMDDFYNKHMSDIENITYFYSKNQILNCIVDDYEDLLATTHSLN